MHKLIASLLVVLATAFTAVAARIDLGSPASFTPYDSYMNPVRQILSRINGEGASMNRVCELMLKGRSFRYSFDEPYVASLPNVTESRKAGDCKDKALWLAKQIGDEGIRFVVGKARRVSNMSHAWLMWKNGGRWWILDCTNNYEPLAADSIDRNEYIPLYSWGKRGVYRHALTRVTDAPAIARKEGVVRGSHSP